MTMPPTAQSGRDECRAAGAADRILRKVLGALGKDIRDGGRLDQIRGLFRRRSAKSTARRHQTTQSPTFIEISEIGRRRRSPDAHVHAAAESHRVRTIKARPAARCFASEDEMERAPVESGEVQPVRISTPPTARRESGCRPGTGRCGAAHSNGSDSACRTPGTACLNGSGGAPSSNLARGFGDRCYDNFRS